MAREEGWGYVDSFTGGSRKAHFFDESSMALCRGWSALGVPRWLLNQWPLQRDEKTHCAKCYREYWKTYQHKAQAEAATP